MSVALLDRRQQRPPDVITRAADCRDDASHMGDGAHRRERPLHARGACTLDQLIAVRWQELASNENVRCPMCHGQMASCDAPAGSKFGHCLDCGTSLA
jgi:tRNA(Ile2) C34 agmatinyltransferase TiaS